MGFASFVQVLLATAAIATTIRPDQANEVSFPVEEARFIRFVLLESHAAQACIDELEVYGPDGQENLALAANGAKASASSCITGYTEHSIAHLNDGRYGNKYSWIPNSAALEWAQIELARVGEVTKVIFSRDRNGQYKDRTAAHFKIQLSVDGEDWKTVREINTRTAQPPTRKNRVASNGFDGFTIMELFPEDRAVEEMLAKYADRPYLLFPEDRRNTIRMTNELPACWVKTGPRDTFEGQAHRGEFYAFQIGVFAARQPISDLDIRFEDLTPESGTGPTIPASAIRCFNKGGINWKGAAFTKVLSIDQGKVQPLWFGVQIPKQLEPSTYTGGITIMPEGAPEARVRLRLEVDNRVLVDAGDGEPWRHSRLRWLDSKIALDDEPAAPFTPMQVNGLTVDCLGRGVTLHRNGLPEQIQSYFSADNMRIVDVGRPILTAPMRLQVEHPDGTTMALSGGTTRVLERKKGIVRWASRAKNGGLHMDLRARMEFDGFVEYLIQVTAAETVIVNDIRLEIPLRRDAAHYMMGMGHRGGLRPARHAWKWDVKKHQDSVWLGDVNAGMRCQLFGENYDRPQVMEGMLMEMPLPHAWHNDGRGGCVIEEIDDETVTLRAFSGARTIQPNETLHFNFTLLLTPFKTLDMKQHWHDRYYHVAANYVKVQQAVDAGANVVNIHQGNELNPYINYPFLTTEPLKKYVQRAHENGIKVKIYNTVRELSTRVVEIWALRSLGDEIYVDGPGGGAPWLRNHLVSNYLVAWTAPLPNGDIDTSIATTPLSRWHNYYLEGLHWLAKNVEIDGLYLDGVGFDRDVMMRARKVLDRARPGSLIDYHCGNTFQPQYGMASVAIRYMDLLPYMDRVWFGEMFDYGGPPDYWLVEISGIPFGLMGEMIGGDRFRGPVYGMIARLGWGGDPQPMWELWDQFGIARADMIGYWVPSCPVRPDHPDVRVTVHTKPKQALIAMASWAAEPVECRLSVDWKALGLDPQRARFHAPEIHNFQPEKVFRPGDRIPIGPHRAWLLIVKET